MSEKNLAADGTPLTPNDEGFQAEKAKAVKEAPVNHPRVVTEHKVENPKPSSKKADGAKA